MSESYFFIQTLLDLEILNRIDIFFAEACLQEKTSSPQKLFLAYLFLVTRSGHHCLCFSEAAVDPYLIFEDQFDKKSFFECLKMGAESLPEGLVQKVSDSLCLKPVVKSTDRFYLQKTYFLETRLIQKIRERLEYSQKIFTEEEVRKKLSEFSSKLHKEQQEAIKDVLKSSFSLLTGGPGTGKTYTAAYLLQVFYLLYSDKKKEAKIALAAPTGKAALRLKESLTKAGCDIGLQATTLHKLLDIKEIFDFSSYQPALNFDLILVDESSMIDLEVFTILLSRVKASTFLVFLGDPHQLPPVETGTVFAELALGKKLRNMSLAHLNQCVRVENKQLLDFARNILETKGIKDFKTFISSSISIVEVKNNRNLQTFVESHLSHYIFSEKLFSPLEKNFCYEGLFSLITKHKLLSPINQGPWGVDEINEKCFQKQLSKAKGCTRFAIPLIITKNDYELGLYNGMEGIYIKHIESNFLENHTEDYALFKRDGEVLKIPLNTLKAYDLAYCLSVHKSQGSEYEKVSLFLPQGSESFGREMLYTAITRAKKNLEVLTHNFSLQKLWKYTSLKKTSLSQRLSP